MTTQPFIVRRDPSRFLASQIEDALIAVRSPVRVVGLLNALGIEAHLCGLGACVLRHGYIYHGDGDWTLLWPAGEPVVGAGPVAARLAKISEALEVGSE